MSVSRLLLPGAASGPVLASAEGLSFWGGVDPGTARVVDARHPLHGESLAGRVLALPTSRGSCSGSGVLLDMALNGRAPAALIFRESEDVLTLGALIAAQMFGARLPVVRLTPEDFARAAQARRIEVGAASLVADGETISLHPLAGAPALTHSDRAILAGAKGDAAALAMRVIVAMAALQGAQDLVDVEQVHIDGCIYASPANLAFAERMAALGARVCVPATTNAISVDRRGWRGQGVAAALGEAAAGLADAYVAMGCAPSFTCAPYLLDGAPREGACIAWAESNAVVYANSVLGARTPKHPDFLDLCIALTGRAPRAGVYLDAARQADLVLEVEWPEGADASVWPLIGWLAGRAAPDRIPLLTGLGAKPSRDDLKALCAAFGTTSAAPMLMIEGITPGARARAGAARSRLTRADIAEGWRTLHEGPAEVDLVAIGSPHASLAELRALAEALAGRRAAIPVIVTTGRDTLAAAGAEGVLARLEATGVRVLADLCWCSISEPVYPPATRSAVTNSAKYAHYGPGLHGRRVRFGALADCATAACDGALPARLPGWLA